MGAQPAEQQKNRVTGLSLGPELRRRPLSEAMENAAQPGVEDLVVRVWGMNANGKAFYQSAYARNLAQMVRCCRVSTML